MKFENTSVHNFQGAFRGMRNPMNSWDKSDSRFDEAGGGALLSYQIGKNDLKLAQSLLAGGTDHSKFMRQIMVSVDVTAPLYWWKEFDTYKVGTVANSTSTMHKLATTPITKDCFELSGVTLQGKPLHYMGEVIGMCEDLRQQFLETKDKNLWRALIQLLPSAWLQTRTITMSYQNIRAMYFARRSHKLSEWSANFIAWVKSLPYACELITYTKEKEAA